MLNRQFREDSIETYKLEEKKFKAVKLNVVEASEKLFKEREQLKLAIEINKKTIIDKIKNKTNEINLEVKKIESESKIYDTFLLEVQNEIATNQNMLSASKTLASDINTFTLTPLSAVAIATTFRTVSTGATIDGTFAANASIFWLAGNTFAAGGLALGGGFLGLIGPVGWGILIARSIVSSGKNKKIGREALEKAISLKEERISLERNEKEVTELEKLIVQNRIGLNRLIDEVEPNVIRYEWDFNRIEQNSEVLYQIGVLINSMSNATKLLNKKIGDEA